MQEQEGRHALRLTSRRPTPGCSSETLMLRSPTSSAWRTLMLLWMAPGELLSCAQRCVVKMRHASSWILAAAHKQAAVQHTSAASRSAAQALRPMVGCAPMLASALYIRECALVGIHACFSHDGLLLGVEVAGACCPQLQPTRPKFDPPMPRCRSAPVPNDYWGLLPPDTQHVEAHGANYLA